ncbi:hypothetical protein MKX01_017218 [Papaver californicum]|nr:hypothetical protein MKX01_017218 [Papaver californicum]
MVSKRRTDPTGAAGESSDKIQDPNEDTVRKDTQPHQFTAQQSDWGHPTFMPLGELNDPGRDYLVDDTYIVEAKVKTKPDDWTFDSRKETGYVGLKNQRARTLFTKLYIIFLISGRRCTICQQLRMIWHQEAASIWLYRLCFISSSTVKITSVLNSSQNLSDRIRTRFTKRHDVHEFNRVLYEKLEDKMMGTVVERTIQRLFEGHHMNHIECINVDYKSTRNESFYDLQLDIKGYPDVYASCDKYVEVERLEGDNKYHADQQHGLQDAKKGVLFIDFPPVLQLYLKRFEYDFTRETRVKINDRYEFPLQLDLDREDHRYLSPDADETVHNRYILHAVLVHSGGGHGGHYCAFVRPTVSEQWFKFNDELVTKVDINQVLEEQYGGEARCANAYMLVYIHESNKDDIICNVEEKDIAEHLRCRLKKEQKKMSVRRRKKKKDLNLSKTLVMVVVLALRLVFFLWNHFPTCIKLPRSQFKLEPSELL